MSAAPPTVPPRPLRAQAAAHGVTSLPDVPPRPVNKRVERSVSPGHYPRSPLNDPPMLTKTKSRDPIPRPPSVHHLPTPGEEGMEYASIQYEPAQPSSALAQDAAAQTRTIGEDLQLHAPKPSLPAASATAQVQSVTRTDASHPIGHHYGRNSQDFGRTSQENLSRTRSRNSIHRPDSAASDRRRSLIYGDEHGPAEMGMRVPINPLLGDVQAPTPAGLSPQVTGDTPRKLGRRRSALGENRPPDSYGLHGHGAGPADKFEREWYMKHPEQLEHEEGQGHGVYESIGSGRGAFALSSEQLNKIVQDSAARERAAGSVTEDKSFPDEQMGYEASEDYRRSQQNTPYPVEQNPLSRVQTHEPPVASPLHSSTFPEDVSGQDSRRNRLSTQSSEPLSPDHESESPYRHHSKHHDGDEDEHEVARDSAKHERRGSTGHYDDYGGSGAHTPHSRPASRPGSIYNLHSASHSLSRFLSHHDERDNMHTPLEDVAEYEPLFDDDESKATAGRIKKRPDTLHHKFPSQDIWEDTPNSAMYVTEVTTPDVPLDDTAKTSAFETPEQEQARKGEVLQSERAELSPQQARALKNRLAHLSRFPSKDIWEDSPDSGYLTTTVSALPADPAEEEVSPTDSRKPDVPARPARPAQDGSVAQKAPPSIPARPQKKPNADTLTKEISNEEIKRVPSIPDRPKPQIPQRPAKKPDDLTKVNSAGSETDRGLTSPPVVKAKPQIPARPGGSHIAALKGNFMSDLNKKLGLGPPKEKEPEPEPAETKPLEDARKSRARGPQRRAPAKNHSSQSGAPPPSNKFTVFAPVSLWSIDEEDALSMAQEKAEAQDHAVPEPKVEEPATVVNGDAKADKEVKEEHISAPPHTADDPKVVAEIPPDPTVPAAAEDVENTEGELTRKTTATSVTGGTLDREDSRDTAHVLPASRMTTASDSAAETAEKLDRVPTNEQPAPVSASTSEEPAEKVAEAAPTEKIAEQEPAEIRSEQVNAANADSAPPQASANEASVSDIPPTQANQPAPGPGNLQATPTEPMNEDDVNYKKLEEMTARADGKAHSEADPETEGGFSSRKVVE